MSRRRLLEATSAGGLSALAGCGGDGADVTASPSATSGGPESLSPSETEPSTTGQPAGGIDVADDDSDVGEGITRLNFGEGLDASVADASATISSSSRNQMPDGSYVAAPGDVQSALDDAKENGFGRVKLEAGSTYDWDEPVVLPEHVTLNCAGALIDITSNIDVFRLREQCRIIQPRINTHKVSGYDSTVFRVFPYKYDDKWGYADETEFVGAVTEPTPLWTVWGGFTQMTPSEGTCIELEASSKDTPPEGEANFGPGGDARNIYFCHIAHSCEGGKRFAYLHSKRRDDIRAAHVNGNIIKGWAGAADRFIETDDDAPDDQNKVNGNKFYLSTQPEDNTDWLWYCNKGKSNELVEWGHNWDWGSYTDTNNDSYWDIWYVGENAGPNYLWEKPDREQFGVRRNIVDKSRGDSGSRLLSVGAMGTPLDEL